MIKMKMRIILACYMLSTFGACISEKLMQQRGLNRGESEVEEYVKDLANKNAMDHRKSLEEKLQLLLDRYNGQNQKREQGTAGLWGKKRQESTAWEEQHDKQGANMEINENYPWNKRAQSTMDGRPFGKAGIWGRQQTTDRITDGIDAFREVKVQKKPAQAGLWGKRARKGSFRLERETSKIHRQPDHTGLWTGKRGQTISGNRKLFRKRVQNPGKTGLWMRGVAGKKKISGRKRFAGNLIKTAYVR